MAKNYEKAFNHAKEQEEKIHKAEVVSEKDLDDLKKDNSTFPKEIAGLSKEMNDFETKRQEKLKESIDGAEKKINIKIESMQKLAGPGIEGEVKTLNKEQNSKQNEVNSINNGIKQER